MDKKLMINRICNRYKMHNQEDYENGWIDFITLRACNDAAENFGSILGGLNDSELTTFYSLDKKIQNKVFDWDSAYCNAFQNQEAVRDLIPILENDFEKSRLYCIPVIFKIVKMYLKDLYMYDKANYEDLGNGMAVYHFNR